MQVNSRQPLLNGQAFGLAGRFEKVVGQAYFAVNPTNAANRIIADIDKAPRGPRGEVEFSADFFLIRPQDPSRGNGTLLYEVSNRGGKGMLSFFNLATGSLNPDEASHFGDGFLLREGYTLLWLGWQFDPPQRDGLLRLFPPIATENGQPIRGLVRSDFVVTKREPFHSLADRAHPYPVVDPDAPGTQMTVRNSVEASRQLIPRTDWLLPALKTKRSSRTPPCVPQGWL